MREDFKEEMGTCLIKVSVTFTFLIGFTSIIFISTLSSIYVYSCETQLVRFARFMMRIVLVKNIDSLIANFWRKKLKFFNR